MDIRKRILKGETKKLAGKVLSDENADKVADFIFEDSDDDKKNKNTHEIKINGNKESDNNEHIDDKNNLSSKIDTWLTKKEKEIDESDISDPVKDLDDMEKRINELNSQLESDDE